MGLVNSLLFRTQGDDRQAADGDTAGIRHPYWRVLGSDGHARVIDSRQRAAIDLMLANETTMARNGWLAIARDHPAQFTLALEQVGTCHHLEGDYRPELDTFRAAIRVGADPARLSGRMISARQEVMPVA